MVDERLTAACWYCADIADTIDHCLPHCVAGEATRKVDCCRDCNSRAGAAMFATMGEKAAHIRGKLEKRYRSLLNTPDWSETELDAMGPTMRQLIEADVERRDRIRMRLRILALRSAVMAPTWEPLS